MVYFTLMVRFTLYVFLCPIKLISECTHILFFFEGMKTETAGAGLFLTRGGVGLGLSRLFVSAIIGSPARGLATASAFSGFGGEHALADGNCEAVTAGLNAEDGGEVALAAFGPAPVSARSLSSLFAFSSLSALFRDCCCFDGVGRVTNILVAGLPSACACCFGAANGTGFA